MPPWQFDTSYLCSRLRRAARVIPCETLSRSLQANLRFELNRHWTVASVPPTVRWVCEKGTAADKPLRAQTSLSLSSDVMMATTPLTATWGGFARWKAPWGETWGAPGAHSQPWFHTSQAVENIQLSKAQEEIPAAGCYAINNVFHFLLCHTFSSN